MFNKNTEGTIFVFPEMKEFSNNCLVMSYEKSQPILLNIRDCIDKAVLLKTCLALTFFQIAW